jgi:hypothetical protein
LVHLWSMQTSAGRSWQFKAVVINKAVDCPVNNCVTHSRHCILPPGSVNASLGFAKDRHRENDNS